MPVAPEQWDFFIAHSGQDKREAEELYGYLKDSFRVFLDSRTLNLGDDWDLELPRAQRSSRVTIVLISNHSESSYYEREEIAAAIAMTRADPARHRVVPCFLKRGAAEREDIPYGLRLKHGISVEDVGGLNKVAEKLAELGHQKADMSANASGILQVSHWLAADTIGFVGQTCRGPAAVPTLLTSWAEYESIFGSDTDPRVSFLSHSVRGFFENGGRRAYVVRVTSPASSNANLRLATADGESFDLTASTPGAWGNALRVRVETGTRVGYRIVIFRDREDGGSELLEDYNNLGSDPYGPNYVLDEIRKRSKWVGAVLGPRFMPTAKPLNVEMQLSGGADGTTVTVADYIGDGQSPHQRVGLEVLEELDDVSLVCVPDHVHPSFEATEQSRITDAVIDHCERLGDRFAILSVCAGQLNVPDLQAPRDTAFAAMYYPWVRMIADAKDEAILVPAAGLVAGAYARSDAERGLHSPPTGQEIRGLALDFHPGESCLEVEVPSEYLDLLEHLGINPLRTDGNTVRMLTSNTMSVDNKSKSVGVQRLMLFIRKAIRRLTWWALFEPNDEPMWTELRANVAEFLTGVWKSGALLGRTAEEAFFVRCGRDTMTEDDIANRRIVIVLGLALPGAADTWVIPFTINQLQ